jgi:RNA polymerase sigma-70 factor (ECF subfamily)
VDDPFDERRLVERARSDPDAFAALYRVHAARVYGLAWRRLGDRAAAEDVTAAAFERAWRGMAKFDWRDGGFPAWILRIAANEVTDHVRRESRARSPRGQRALSMLAPVGSDVDDTAAADPGDDRELRAALDRIRPRYGEAISLRYFAGLDNAQAAAALGCSASTFAVVLHRAQEALKRELGRKEVSHG